MTKPTDKKDRPKPAPGKGEEWRRDPDGSWHRFEDPDELQRHLKEVMAQAEREDPHGIWRQLDAVARQFHRAAEIDKDEALDEIGFILPALRDPKVRKAAVHAATAYYKTRPGFRKRTIEGEAELLKSGAAEALARGESAARIAEMILDALPNLRKLHYRAKDSPRWELDEWITERDATITRIAEAIASEIIGPDSTKAALRKAGAAIFRAAMKELGGAGVKYR